ncbi:MAG: hypothetical protein SAK29_38405 [Scytonema sp. PMC 1069.18]|nr:hypothetical protein [Scytonema sp. PMC 1069.18]MEC4881278.1 hypothetical protein [Scytonema sp. PMC 1070.18]
MAVPFLFFLVNYQLFQQRVRTTEKGAIAQHPHSSLTYFPAFGSSPEVLTKNLASTAMGNSQ